MPNVIAGDVFPMLLKLERAAGAAAEQFTGPSRDGRVRQPQLKLINHSANFGIASHELADSTALVLVCEALPCNNSATHR